jgi:hypothetical protein
MLAAMSVAFRLEWGNFHTPWAAAPYFSEGRYVGWALLPFAVASTRGLQALTSSLPPRWRAPAAWAFLGGVALAVTAGEIALARPVFASAWNWYHLP